MTKQQKSYPLFYRENIVSIWLFGMCAMVFAMIVLGGLTRLTDSGLSMVDWKPITGWLPPLSDQDWRTVFSAYQEIPEYQEINAGMSVEEFKGIFWLEYIHRLWGRVIGLAFAGPFVFFALRGWIDRRSMPALLVFFVLGALQGVLGWYMVKSGLVDRVDVSQYRLTAHLGLAVVIYALMLRYAFRVRQGYEAIRPVLSTDMVRVRTGLVVLSCLIFLTVLSGGFVAGLDAGLTYNTFPFMDGKLVPRGLYGGENGLLNAFEDVATVQFHHRILAVFTVSCLLVFWVLSLGTDLMPQQRMAYGIVVLVGIGQAALGISTLILAVPIVLAAAHQVGALLFLSTTLYALHHVEWGKSVL